ncbi:MAG TPA: HDOD domain-containing protein, partial [Methylomirabilota bacterium]|nr:HDOD domain-containing protein [Methylomirabilota bacterium]
MNEPPKTSALLKDLRERGQLPALDENIATLCSLAGDPMACAAELTSVILRDAALTANVLSVANSAAFGPAEPVKTVSAAILLMGFERVRCLATGLGILRQLDRDP